MLKVAFVLLLEGNKEPVIIESGPVAEGFDD